MANDLKQADLEKLMALNSKLGSDTDIVKKIDLISTTIKEIVKAERCSIFVYDQNTKSFWTAYADGISYIEIPEGKGIVGEVFETKKTIVENDVQKRSKFYGKIDKDSGFQTKSMIAMPIIGFGDNCIGVVQLLNKYDDGSFEEKDIKVLQFVTNHFTAYVQTMAYEHQ